jgi:hypothetical protein
MAEPVALGIKPPQVMTLADMLGIARGAQAYQQAEQANPLELKRLQAEANVAAGTEKPRIVQATQAARTAEIGTNKAQLENMLMHQQNSSRNLLKLLNQKEPVTPELIEEHVVSTMKNAGAPQEAIVQATQNLPKQGTDKELRAFIAKHATNSLTAEAQLEKLFPSAQFVQTGATITPVTGGSPQLAAQAPGNIAGPSIEAQLSPSTEIIDPTTGQKKLLGPVSQRSNAPLVTQLGPAQQAAQTGVGETVKGDWATTYADAQQAPARIGIFQNIKKLTPEALTGPTAERRQVVASFAQMLGIPVATLETTATDELVKNTKLLQLAGGNTDAARALAEFANPNTKMTKEGIARVTDQLIGIEKMKVAKSNFVQPFAGNADAYQTKVNQFNQIADPRLFQEMTPADVAKLRKSMSPADQAELSRKIKLARELGVL